MRIQQQNTAEYSAKVAALFSEVDYALFQEQATELIKQYHDKASLEQWTLFCRYLNGLNEKQPILFLLMQLAFRCFEAPLTHSHLAQLITLAQQLISVYGVGAYRALCEAAVPEKDRQLPLYLTALQLLVDLYEVKGIADEVTKHLPNLQRLIAYLHSAQNDYLSSLHPKRDVDEVLGYFATPNAITRFPLDKLTLMTFKEDYLGICTQMERAKKLPQAELKEQFLENAKQWRDKQNLQAKQIMVAIMAETIRRFYKILPYDTQIIAFLALIRELSPMLRGRIAQIKAGEGKSTVFAMLIAFKAAQGYFVDLITSSGYLAIRDYKKYRPFLKALGITSSHISYAQPTQACFHAQVLYGTNADFEFALLRDGLNEEKLRYSYSLGEHQL
ncbi:MAG: hypothetical protein K2Q33_05395, partial [Gammaproteobacteria bacterium]|nr:hypothetical protein [Gammaproteobacteria bacterium]